MASDPHTLGTRIRRARERARLSQEELAKAVGASPRAVGDWENDRRKPRNRLGALEDVLGVRLDGEPDEPQAPTPEDAEALRAHIREVLGPGSDMEEALDRLMAGAPPPPSGAGRGRSGGAAAARWGHAGPPRATRTS